MITRDQALAALDKAVEDYGADYVDANALDAAGCVYSRMDTKTGAVRHCIAGYALKELGLEPPPPRSAYNALSFIELLERKGWEPKFSRAAVYALAKAQTRQDDGLPWGEAVEGAKTYRVRADDTKPWGEDD